MTILFLVRRYYPYLGGVETHVQSIVEILTKKGYKVQIITQQFSEKELLREKCGNADVFRIPLACDDNKRQTWNWIQGHKEIFNNADIIHIHDIFWWVLPIFWDNRKKIYTTFHGWEGVYPIPITNKLQRYIYAKLSQKTIHVGSWIKELYFDKPNFIVYGGVNDINYQQSKLKFHKESVRFCFIGRLSKDNDVGKYIEILKKLKQQAVSYSITWVGDGEFRKQCEMYGTVTGMIEDYDEVLQKSDIVFASSYLSMLQAQAAGKLVIATYSHFLKKRYLETYPIREGVIVSSSVENITERITKLDTDTLSKEIKKAQQELHNFTWENVTQQYITLWDI